MTLNLSWLRVGSAARTHEELRATIPTLHVEGEIYLSLLYPYPTFGYVVWSEAVCGQDLLGMHPALVFIPFMMCVDALLLC